MASTEQSLNLTQRLGMRLSAQQLRFVKLLECNAPELEAAVERELDDNPALEEEDFTSHHESLEEPNKWKDFTGSYTTRPEIDYDSLRFDSGEDLYVTLRSQLASMKVSPEVAETADYIIGSLDSDGYLRRPLSNIINDMAFGPGIEISKETGEEALRIVRSLDPAGVGAADLRDCLLLQIDRLPGSQEREDARAIIDSQFDAFLKRHTHRIVSGLKIPRQRAIDAIELIRSLNPQPGKSFSSPEDNLDVIIPDFYVNNDDGKLTIGINNNIPELRIERGFQEAMKEIEGDKNKLKSGDGQYIMARYNDARDFINTLTHRQETLMKVMTAIVDIQKDYFLTEDVYRMRPMMIKDIAALTGLDMSVISRATANKYVATSWGILPLRHFFSDSVGDDSPEVLTNRQTEAAVTEIIEAEDKRHPLSDDDIQKALAAKGYVVSRRTVNKYRGRLGIPPARLRKSL